MSALAGIKVMRRLSAVHVVVFNTSRSVIVWAFSLAVNWQNFQALQIFGFLFIVLGVMVFNDILIGKVLKMIILSSKANFEHIFKSLRSLNPKIYYKPEKIHKCYLRSRK